METNNKNKLETTFDGSFGNGWRVMSKEFLVLLLVVIILGVVQAPAQIFRINIKPEHWNWQWNWHHLDFFNTGNFAVLGFLAVILGIFAIAYAFLVIPIFNYGADLMFLHAVRGIRPQFETLISGFKENYLYIVFANLLKTALFILGIIFCIVPGIIVACRLVFVPYLVMDKKLDPIVAVEESWRMSKGHGWTIFLMGFVSFFIYIFGLILLFVGILPASMWVKSSFASMYEAVMLEKNASTATITE